MASIINQFFRSIRGLRRRRYFLFKAIIIALLLFLIYIKFYRFVLNNSSWQQKFSSKSEDYSNYGTYEIHIKKWTKNLHQIPDFNMPREGPGENGKAVKDSDGKNSIDVKLAMKKWFMNLPASDKISLDRSLPDQRSKQCQTLTYSIDKFPKASVVIIFTDEAWSPLLRTVHSVINRTPKNLLKEIVLIDDFSQRDELKLKLENYLGRFNGLVRLYRSPIRLGLIRAKIVGAKFAIGEVVVFLDSHCEATNGWIEPLLQRIHEEPTAVVCPVIDSISDTNMQYNGGTINGIGTFWWSLHYRMDEMPAAEKQRRKHPQTDYLKTPTMAGGLFALNREYFFKIGAYDPEMDIWGGENLEISFRVWMCGGSVEILPCSHVGHIYRNGHPYNMTGRGGNTDVHGTNSKRLAEVWMDDYKRLFYMHRMGLKDDNQFIGDLSSRRELRKQLNCHSFKWYLENVIPEKFILDENVKAYGLVQNSNGILCLDTLQRLENKGTIILGLFSCQIAGSSSQMFSWSMDGQLRRETTCVDVDSKILANGKRKAILRECNKMNIAVFQHLKGDVLRHIKYGLCLDVNGLESGDDVIFTKCDANSITQKWTFLGKYI